MSGAAQVPPYMRTGRIFCLSKEKTEYAKIGNIRTISILPVTTELYELTLLKYLNDDIARLKSIPMNQRGFVNKCSTFDNLIDIFQLIKQGKSRQ